MTAQPPVGPPQQPPHLEAGPATMPMSAAGSAPVAAPPVPPRTGGWQQATSTPGGRWAIVVAAAALALLLLLVVGIAGFAVLRNHDRVSLLGNRADSFSRGQNGNGFGQGPGRGDGAVPGMPSAPGGRAPGPQQPGGRLPGMGGLGSLLAGSALHGSVTATVDGSVQALVFQRGEVTAVSATSITLKSSDGFVGTYGRTAATTSRGAAPVKGAQAFVLARGSDKVAISTLSLPGKFALTPSS